MVRIPASFIIFLLFDIATPLHIRPHVQFWEHPTSNPFFDHCLLYRSFEAPTVQSIIADRNAALKKGKTNNHITKYSDGGVAFCQRQE
jgi:hypothetical protein